MLWGQQPNPGRGRGSGSRIGRCESGTWAYFLSETPRRHAGSEISRTHRWLLHHKCPKTFLVSRKPIKLAQRFLPNSRPREPHGDRTWHRILPPFWFFSLCASFAKDTLVLEGLTWGPDPRGGISDLGCHAFLRGCFLFICRCISHSNSTLRPCITPRSRQTFPLSWCFLRWITSTG